MIKSVLCATSGGSVTLEADTFIDATGNGTLSMLAGCHFHLGRAGNRLCKPMTLCFRVDQADKAQFQQNRARIKQPRAFDGHSDWHARKPHD